VPISEVDCLCLALYRLVGNSWKVTKTPVGLGLSHSYVLLLISEGSTDWWTLRYELGTLGLVGCWPLQFIGRSTMSDGRSSVNWLLSGSLAIRLYNSMNTLWGTVDTLRF
jgi:hypothetical protein